MKHLLLLFAFIGLTNVLRAQYVYVIKADSVKITNCDSAELIIENHTQAVPGFLFNTGNGRTVFKKAVMQLDDSTYVIGADTLHTDRPSYWKANGIHIYNTNAGNVGIGRFSPNVLLDLPGPVNIDDTSAYRINYHPVLNIGGYDPDDYFLNTSIYTNLFVGDSTGLGISYPNFDTYVGNAAGQHSTGPFNTYVGSGAGQQSIGQDNTAVGFLAGQFASLDNSGGGGTNSYFGSWAGAGSGGGYNTILGANAGSSNVGSFNALVGEDAGGANYGSYNSSLGYYGGRNSHGDENCFIGYASGSSNNGNRNIGLGRNAGQGVAGNENISIGYNTGALNSGTMNTFVGSESGYHSGFQDHQNYVTLLGSKANVPLGLSLTDATAVGYGAVAQASNSMTFGDTAVKTWYFNSNAPAISGAALVVGSGSTNGNGAYLTTGGVWTNASDRFKKEHFETLDNNEVLDKIGQLPISRWNYKGLPEQHIGPVAQDFYRIFHVGMDDKTISTIDPSGIALAGIQGLYVKWKASEQRTLELEATIRSQAADIQDLRAQVQKQQALLNQLLEKINIQK